MLEVVNVEYPDMRPEFAEFGKSDLIHLPHLRSFTQVHEARGMVYPTELLDRLSLPPTCSVAFKLFLSGCKEADVRIRRLFPTTDRKTNFADVRGVKIKVPPDPPPKGANSSLSSSS